VTRKNTLVKNRIGLTSSKLERSSCADNVNSCYCRKAVDQEHRTRSSAIAVIADRTACSSTIG